MSEVERQRQLARELSQVTRRFEDLRESAIAHMLFAAWIDVLAITNEDEAIRVFASYLNNSKSTGGLKRSG